MKTITTNRGKNNTPLNHSQQNASLSLTFRDLVNELQLVEDGKLRGKIAQHVQKLTSEEKGKLFVKCLPYMKLKTGSYREAGGLTGISHTQIRDWVMKYAPEIFLERSRGGEKS